MAQRILKNNTASPVPISDVGQTVPASGQLTINPVDYGKYEGSDDVITLIGASTLTVNDGTFDLSITDGTRLIQGGFYLPVSDGDDPTIKANVITGVVKRLAVDAAVSSSTLPTGAATAANQATEIASLSSMDTKLTSQATAANQTTEITKLTSIDGKLNSLGQKTMAGSVPMTLASDQPAIPVSAASLPLPTGAATAVNQATEIASLASIDTKLSSQATAANQVTELATLASIDAGIPTSLGQKPMATSMPIVVASDQSAIPISASSLPLPTGAATAANQVTANATLAAIDGGIPVALGQTTMANSMPVVIPSDQIISTIPTIVGVPLYDDMNATNGGVARGTAISTTFTNLYSYTGSGLFYGFSVNLNGLANWNIRLLVDGTEVFMGTTGINLGDASTNTIYGLNQAKMLGVSQVGATSFVFELANPIKFASSIVVKAKITGGAKNFTGGFAMRSA